MLTIRQEQMDVFREELQRRLVDRLAEETNTDRAKVETTVKQALGYGIDAKEDIRRYVLLRQSLKTGVPAWMRSILKDTTLNGAAKMALISGTMRRL